MLGNARKYSEILGNTRKYSEILGNTRKEGVLPVRFAAPCLPQCTHVYPPEILGNARQYPSIRWEILRYSRKCSEKLAKSRKYQEILGNPRKQGVLPVRFAAAQCTPVSPCVPPEILGNARQYPSIRREILRYSRKCTEMLGNTRINSEILG